MAVRFHVFKKVQVDVRRVLRAHEKAGHSAMKQFGAILRRSARRKIRRRMVTAKMQERLSEAEKGDDQKRIARLKATIAKRRAETSQPGNPPIAHTPDAPFRIRDIRFAATSKNVIVGPAGSGRRLVNSNRVTVPEILEFSGNKTLEEIRVGRGRNVVWIPNRQRRVASWQKTRTKRVIVAARPFMGPTLKEQSPKLAGIYAKAFGK